VVEGAGMIATSSEIGQKMHRKLIRARTRGSHAPGCWTHVVARGTVVGEETSLWWSPMSCEPGGGVTSESICVMVEKHETRWRRVLFTRGKKVSKAVSLDRKKNLKKLISS
jgi:hypothetical protein